MRCAQWPGKKLKWDLSSGKHNRMGIEVPWLLPKRERMNENNGKSKIW